jgi:RNA polymerase-binding transcription factor DksA
MKELQLQDDFVYNNEEEAEMGQLHAIHNNMNAVAGVRRQLAAQAAMPSAEECAECGDAIPEARRIAVTGCKLCVICKEKQERK